MDEIVARIDAISGDDPERAHSEMDDILLEPVEPEVRAAVVRLHGRCRWWACA